MKESEKIKVLELIADNISPKRSIEFYDSEENLMNIGVDSMSLIKIIVAIEQEFDFEFDDEGLSLGNFDNITSIVSYVESRI